MMKTIQIGDKTIGDDNPTYIIAEVGICHNGNLDTARRLIDAAADSRVDAVKFQKRCLKAIYSSDVLDNPWKYEQSFQYIIPILKSVELSLDDHSRLKSHAESLGLEYICTPFDRVSAGQLNLLGVRAYKVASCDLTNHELIEILCNTGKPLILSTGMSSWDEIKATVNFLKERSAEFALLHCRSSYPVWPREVNLKMITKLKQFGVPVGYSGHDVGTTIPLVAASMGASIVEKHITLDRYAKGPDHKISLLPDELKILVRDIRIADQCMADSSRFLLRGEILNRDVFRYRGIAISDPGAFGSVLEHNPVGRWGLITRPHDMSIMKWNPKCVEFHLTENDLDTVPESESYDCELIVHCPEYIGDKLSDLCSGDDEIRYRSICMVQRTIDWAAQVKERFVGCPKVIVHPGAMSMSSRLKTNTMANNLIKSLEEIDDNDAELLLENLPPYPWYFGGQWKGNYFLDADEIREFCDETGFKICFDLSHAALYCNAKGKDLSEFIRTVKPFIRHIHFADAYGMDGEGVQIGDGDIDFEKIMLLFSDYTGTWVPEIWRGHQNGNSGAIEALNKIEKILTR